MLIRAAARGLAVLLLGVNVCVADSQNAPTSVSDFKLTDSRGTEQSLSGYQEKPAVVLAFLGTECPLAKACAARLAGLQREYGGRGVVILGVFANRQDSVADMVAFGKAQQLEFPLLKDAGNVLADRLNVQRTPEVFVLDAQRVVRYRGQIDDQAGIGFSRPAARVNYLTDALEAVLAGREVKLSRTEPEGCLIGRARKPVENGRVTWSGQISRLVNQHCVNCHREGEIAPFPLTSYEEAAGWGDMMLEVVREGRMPPWHASPEHSRFRNARGLTAEEQSQLKQWVADGCPEGNPSDLPSAPVFTDGWQLPREPDAVIAMRDRPFDVPATGEVRYQYFRASTGFKEDRWIKAAELVPGNRSVVHHILVLIAPSGGRNAATRETAGEFLAAYVPGNRFREYPAGMAKLIPAGSDLIFQMHYTPTGTAQQDLSRLGLVFAKPEEVKHVVITRNAVNHKDLVIPPGDGNFRVEASSTRAPSDMQLLALMPHMHLRGKAFSYELLLPGGGRETVLDVPRYDFNWQTAYEFAEPLTIPKGAQMHCVAHFDNSEANLNNPDPKATVKWGDQTYEEMMIGYFDVAVPIESLGLQPATAAPKKPAVTDAALVRARQRLMTAIRLLDRNKDGQLSVEECPEKYRKIFDALDRDMNKSVTDAEVRDGFEQLRSLDLSGS